MSDKPVYTAYETVISAAAMNSIADCVWDALGEASTPVAARAAIGAMEAAPSGGPWLGQDNAWVGLVAIEHPDLGSRDSSDGHPISAITGLQSALDDKSATGHTHVESDITDLDRGVERLVWERVYATDDTFDSNLIDINPNCRYRIVGIGLNAKSVDTTVYMQVCTAAGNLSSSVYTRHVILQWEAAASGDVGTSFVVEAGINMGGLPRNSRNVALNFELSLHVHSTPNYSGYKGWATGWTSLLARYHEENGGHIYGSGAAADPITGIRIYCDAGASTLMQRGKIQVYEGPIA